MTRLNLLLLLVLLASSLVLVKTSYESRRLFAAVDSARVDARELDAEFERLDAERRAQATHLRVEKVAREQLKMRSATPAVTTYVLDPAAPEAIPAPAPAPEAGGQR
jgi:cell division protein FtsL